MIIMKDSSIVLFITFVLFAYVHGNEDKSRGKPVIKTHHENIVKIYNGKLFINCVIRNETFLADLWKAEVDAIAEEKKKGKESSNNPMDVLSGKNKPRKPLTGLTWYNVTDAANRVQIVKPEVESTEEVKDDQVDDDEDKKKKEPVIFEGTKLILHSDHEYNLLGKFECVYEEASTTYRSIRPLIVNKFKPSYTVTEGDDKKIHCKVKDPKPDTFSVKWFIKNDGDADENRAEINSTTEGAEPHIKTFVKDDVIDAELKIEDAMKNDRAIYICEVTSEEETVTLETLIRVKDKYAALWPFIGIVVEVVLLCIVILACEKRKEGDDVDDDIGGNGNAHESENSNLRHRK